MYCQYCGAKVYSKDQYCGHCGKRIILHHRNRAVHQEPIEKLACELAYCGFGFFLPLFIETKELPGRRCSNQGLWMLILATIACTSIQIAEFIQMLFKGTFLYMLFNATYSLLFIAFLMFMLYLSYKGIKNVLEIHNDEEIEDILFFDKLRIIKE